jgi:hypothetical protein
MIAENKVVCTDLVHNHNTDGSSILKQQINNSVKRKAQEDICERPAKLIHQEIANATQDCSDETVDMRALENIRNSYLRYKTGSNVFMDELVNYRSSPIGRDL